MVAISQLWYNGSYTIAAKPIKTLESHYTMIQFLIIRNITRQLVMVSLPLNPFLFYHRKTILRNYAVKLCQKLCPSQVCEAQEMSIKV